MGRTGEKGRDHCMLSIGFVFDPPPIHDKHLDDVSVEYEDPETIDWLFETLACIGSVVKIPWSSNTADLLLQVRPDVLFNITEASGSRNRESLLPALAEGLGIPYTGSDAVCLGVSLDKYLTKIVASHLGIRTPPFAIIHPGKPPEEIAGIVGELADELSFPLIVKPNTGGSSMGIREDSRVEDRDGLLRALRSGLSVFEEPMLVEGFVEGRELTVGIVCRGDKIEVLPVAEVEFEDTVGDAKSFYSIERKSLHQKRVICPASVESGTAEAAETASVAIFEALGCVDMARIDFRLRDSGDPQFIEINPLPGLSPFYSIFPMQAKAAGISAEELVGILIENALKRGKGGTADG